MPGSTFRGDPYRVLDVSPDASADQIKRRWRELAREHHPDRAASRSEQGQLTTRMARINAAYDILRDPVRRARYDASPDAHRARDAAASPGRSTGWAHAPAEGRPERAGPPPPPPTRPVTARFDTSAAYRPRNATTTGSRPYLRGQVPLDRRTFQARRDLRASTPTGPVTRSHHRLRPRQPSLAESRATLLEFGRFQGLSLGDVADREPTYIDWIARTITRDRDLVVRARVIAADLDERGIVRDTRPARPGFGAPGEWAGESEAAERSAW